jgi:hypothetical protein
LCLDLAVRSLRPPCNPALACSRRDHRKPAGTRNCLDCAAPTSPKNEKLALVALLTRTIADDRYLLSLRIRSLREILA